MEEENMIPTFPPKILNDNQKAIDWASCGLIAYASGSVINLSYLDRNILQRLCPIETGCDTISCLKFHPKDRIIAVGDTKGNISIFNFDNHDRIASAKPLHKNSKCLCMQWYENNLLVLLNNKCFYCLQHKNGSSQKDMINLIHKWKLNLTGSYSSFSIDPHYHHFVLFSGSTKSKNSSSNSIGSTSDSQTFSIYKFDKPIEDEPPTSYFENFQLTYGDIRDAQWSIHLPGYIFLVLKDQIIFFHLDSSSILPLIQRSSTSNYNFLLQLSDDFTSFYTIHQNGSISLYQFERNINSDKIGFIVKKEITIPQLGGNIISAILSPFDDTKIVFLHNNQGLILFSKIPNKNVMLMTSVDSSFPSEPSSFDADGINYVIGTSDGFVQIGSLFDFTNQKRFKVSDKPVIYVCFDATLMKVYWRTELSLGSIDIHTRTVSSFQNRSIVMNCFGSHHGAFIVQRAPTVLGIFINGKEKPLLLKRDIVDVSVSDESSSISEGNFTVLLDNQEVHFYSYSKEGISEIGSGMKPRGYDTEAICFNDTATRFATASSTGIISICDKSTKKVTKIITDILQIHRLELHDFGITAISKDHNMFVQEPDVIKYCPMPILDYRVISVGSEPERTIITLGADHVLRLLHFFDSAGFIPLEQSTKFRLAPSEDIMLSSFILKQSIFEKKNCEDRNFFLQEVRDCWKCLDPDPRNLRLQAIAAVGSPGIYENINSRILESLGSETKRDIRLKFTSLLFSGRFADASRLISSSDPSSSSFMSDTLFSVILGFLDPQFGTVPDFAQIQLKNAGVALVGSSKYEDAALLFRIGRLDRFAAEYLTDCGQEELAMRFVRSCLTPSEKKVVIFKMGCKALDEKRFSDALAFFAGAGEFHAVLFVLMDLGYVTDAYYLMKELQKRQMLEPLKDAYKPYLTAIQNLESLCNFIERQFQLVLLRLEIPSEKLK